MIDNMRKMLRWHFEEFDFMPIGDGFEVDVTEFDFREENGLCYDKNGVTVRHWPRSHGKDGASAYRLDWNGLSFVWTGDGRPDELTVKYSQGVDVFVTEVQNDLGQLMSMKMGMPPAMYNYMIDTHHTPHYAAGYLMKEINPRIGMVTHMEYEPALSEELIGGIRAHWDGLFVIGAPDVQVVNVTKDAIWSREAALPELAGISQLKPDEMAKAMELKEMPDVIEFPPAKIPREEQQIPYLREMEIDPAEYYPEEVIRELILECPPIKINVKEAMAAKEHDAD
jgi:ribonuclease Z